MFSKIVLSRGGTFAHAPDGQIPPATTNAQKTVVFVTRRAMTEVVER
jgi:hypothetical protein